MAKKKKIIEEPKSEPVANCDQFVKVNANSSQSEAAKPSGDQSKDVVTNCDNQQFAVTIGDHKNIDIKLLCLQSETPNSQ